MKHNRSPQGNLQALWVFRGENTPHNKQLTPSSAQLAQKRLQLRQGIGYAKAAIAERRKGH